MDGPVDGGKTPFWSALADAADGTGHVEGAKLTVLAVDDEPEIVSLYATWLTPACTVRTAVTGQGALDRLDEGVDIVVADRQLPDAPGDDLLRSVAASDCAARVVVVSAVEPDLDVVGLPFDRYLTKPVDRTTLHEAVEWVRRHDGRPPAVVEYLTLEHKLTLLRRSAVALELDASSVFRRLRDRRDEAKHRAQTHAETTVDGSTSLTECSRLIGE
jgi:DNA-binding response OmpR family regulator